MPAFKPRVRSDLAIVELDGEAVIYDRQTGRLHHLNPAATVVFRLCDGSATVKELAAGIAEIYDQPEQHVEQQIRSLIRGLREAMLLEGSLILAEKEGAPTHG